MWQSGAIESVRTVEDLWQGSVLQEYGVYAGSVPVVQGAQYFVWAFLFLIFFCLVFRSQTGVFFSWAGGFLLSPGKRTYFDTSASVRYGLPMSMLILLPLAAFLVYGTSAVEVPYVWILGSIAGYLLLRLLLLQGIAYVSGSTEIVTVLQRMTFIVFAIAVMVFCVILMIGMFLPGIYPLLMDRVVWAVTAVLLFLYLVELLRIFFMYREPLLLSILYLCTLEFLPIALAIVTVLKF